MIDKKIVKHLNILDKYKVIINKTETIRSLGSVQEVVGNTIISKGPDVQLGELCHIEKVVNKEYILAEVVGFRQNDIILAPLEKINGIFPGSRVLSTGSPIKVSMGNELLGRVIDGLGNPLDTKGKFFSAESRTLYNKAPNPLTRPMITEKMLTGIKAIDSFLTIGKGQRIGVFAGSGIGKSTLLGMIARYAQSDVNVIGMVGERGREVAEFIKNDLGEIGLKKSVLVVASSNESPMHRVRAAYLTVSIAEYFREKGKNVLLLMDSLTRLAMAQREIGLAAGEPATSKGYPPSVFTMLPDLLERTGNSVDGSITGVFSVLAEGDDLNDPIVDTARGILDGHIVLSRKLAQKSHYPAIDIPASISRSMNSVVDNEHQKTGSQFREFLAEYQNNEEIIQLGAYVKGANQVLDKAMVVMPSLNRFLQQRVEEYQSFETTYRQLKEIQKMITTDSMRLRKVS